MIDITEAQAREAERRHINNSGSFRSTASSSTVDGRRVSEEDALAYVGAVVLVAQLMMPQSTHSLHHPPHTARHAVRRKRRRTNSNRQLATWHTTRR